MREKTEGREQSHGPKNQGRMVICARLREEIARCESEFEAKKSDPFEGTVLDAELGMLRAQYERLEKGETLEALCARLREIKRELEEARKKEELSATFDWYDEHYYYKIYDGQLRACGIVAELLESVFSFSFT